MRAGLARAGVALALIVTSCGGSSGDGGSASTVPSLITATTDQTTTRPPPTTSTPTTSVSPTTTETPIAQAAGLAWRDARPPFLLEQVGLNVGGGTSEFDCPASDQPAAVLPIVPERGVIQIGYSVQACFPGFDLSSDVKIEIIAPSGPVKSLTLGEEYIVEASPLGFDQGQDVHNYWWRHRPGDELGRYEVRGTQGGVTVEASYQVEANTYPTFFVEPSSARDHFEFWHPTIVPGDEFVLTAVGFEDAPQLDVHLYGGPYFTDGNRAYITTISIPLDESGYGSASFQTSLADSNYQLCPILAGDHAELVWGDDSFARNGYDHWCRWKSFDTYLSEWVVVLPGNEVGPYLDLGIDAKYVPYTFRESLAADFDVYVGEGWQDREPADEYCTRIVESGLVEGCSVVFASPRTGG